MKPVILSVLDNQVIVLRLADRRLLMVFLQGQTDDQEITARLSGDNGRTWSAPTTMLKLPAGVGTFHGYHVLLDRNNELHIHLLNDAGGAFVSQGESERVLSGEMWKKRLDIWHVKSADHTRTWNTPRLIWKGYTGALNSDLLLKNGRLVVPFSYATLRSWRNRGKGLDEFTAMGYYNCTVIYSDDEGDNWHLANDLKVPVPDVVSAYGAVEPVVLELKDGRLWMLIRTQMGRFWESFSKDGAAWSSPRPTAIISSDSPAGLVRLDDGRIVLFWNNCLRFPYAYGGRHVIHAAISSDEGKTWHGCREVARDPRRNDPPPAGSDFGTAYPLPVVVNDGKVMYCTGQGAGRVLLMALDPEWLMETVVKADFDAAPDEWSVFGTKGVSFSTHPEKTTAKILRIQKVAEDWPAVAVWNFPAGRSGRLALRFMLTPGVANVRLGLADHFSPPFDFEDHFYNLVNIELASDRRLLDAKLEVRRWYELTLNWNYAERHCTLDLDGRSIGTLPLLRESSGACYLRLGSPVGAPAEGALLVESVAVEVAKA